MHEWSTDKDIIVDTPPGSPPEYVLYSNDSELRSNKWLPNGGRCSNCNLARGGGLYSIVACTFYLAKIWPLTTHLGQKPEQFSYMLLLLFLHTTPDPSRARGKVYTRPFWVRNLSQSGGICLPVKPQGVQPSRGRYWGHPVGLVCSESYSIVDLRLMFSNGPYHKSQRELVCLHRRQQFHQAPEDRQRGARRDITEIHDRTKDSNFLTLLDLPQEPATSCPPRALTGQRQILEMPLEDRTSSMWVGSDCRRSLQSSPLSWGTPFSLCWERGGWRSGWVTFCSTTRPWENISNSSARFSNF